MQRAFSLQTQIIVVVPVVAINFTKNKINDTDATKIERYE
jgi:hypothetical protein